MIFSLIFFRRVNKLFKTAFYLLFNMVKEVELFVTLETICIFGYILA